MNTATNKKLIIERKGFIAIFTINCPEKRNALSDELLIDLHNNLVLLSRNNDIRCVIFKGAGDKVFSSGYDIGAIPVKNASDPGTEPKTPDALIQALAAIKNFAFPTIAMMNGHAFGAGFNLCACCDIRIAADDIKLGMPPAKLGIVYHPKGMQQFLEAFGMQTTKEIFYTASVFQGDTLLQKGLADYLIPKADLEKFTFEYALSITRNAPLALKGNKEIIAMFEKEMTLGPENMEKALELVQQSLKSDDVKEGQTAFLEKREPKFKGC
ncbi:MAG: enoyl-CoA hydratase [Desulfobacteraceae bacterium]|nr:enoyl-CoA hydratase [Desulfobacteraceae bacterium]